MGYGTYLKELLSPLGVYDMTGIGGAELESVGAALDPCGTLLERTEREMSLATAQDEGLEAVASLLARRPVTNDPARLREALAALLRVGGDSFTLSAINDNLIGCGLNAVASETGTPGVVQVRFPDVAGIPEGFEEMRVILEDILPCHLEIEYEFWRASWTLVERLFPTWGDVVEGATWEQVERAMGMEVK